MGTAVERIHSRATLATMLREINNDSSTGWLDPLLYKRNSNQKSEEYVDMGFPPAMREWVGKRAPKTIREETFTITAKKYETSVVIPRDDLVLEKADLVRSHYILPLAQRAGSQHLKKLTTATIEAGESALCYDGQYFFDTDHASASSGSQSNDITASASSTTAPTAAEATTAIIKAAYTMMGFKDDQGELMNEAADSFIVMVPLTFMEAFNVALNANLTGNGASNALQVQGLNLQLVINPRLTWTTKFALFNANTAAKPFIWQEVESPRLSAKAEGSDFEHDNDAHEYGVSVWRAVGYGAWSSACLVTLT